MMKCDCGFTQPDSFSFCVNCGNKLKETKEQPVCEHEKESLYFCPHCGEQLKYKPTPKERAEEQQRKEREEEYRNRIILSVILTILAITSISALGLRVMKLFL